MDSMLTLVALVLAAWLLLQLLLSHASLAEGRTIQPLCKLFPELKACKEPVLVYCFSPRCSPCRRMTPEIEALHAETGRAYSLDVSQHLDLAREMGIRATPTVLVVKDGTVQRSVVGAKDRKFLTRLLAA